MALPSSGEISLLDIATEFGGSAPHSLDECFGVATGIPSSGVISLDDFYGAASSSTTEYTVVVGAFADISKVGHYGFINALWELDSSPVADAGSVSADTFEGHDIDYIATTNTSGYERTSFQILTSTTLALGSGFITGITLNGTYFAESTSSYSNNDKYEEGDLLIHNWSWEGIGIPYTAEGTTVNFTVHH